MLKMYIRFLESQSKSECTISSYVSDINQMLKIVNKDPKDVTILDLDNWMYEIKDLEASSIYRKVMAIKSFFGWATSREVISKNPSLNIEPPKVIAKEKEEVLTSEDVKTLLEVANNARDKALISVLANTGLRIAEVLNLKLDQLERERLIVPTKGGKFREVYLNENCAKDIQNYIKVRKENKDGLLFVSNQGSIMREDSINKTLKKLAKKAGVEKNVYPHLFRHFFTTKSVEQFGIEITQKAVGHSNIQTTQRYTHIDRDKVKESMLNFQI